ncbi:hypothetical protein [Lentzea albida]|uniref:Uncharacterized protein n=1 Tax=Lentzea albida TaxID=65499 RepID=A0A1H9USA1_9PSEU|nr:hypothetical protein [Lentzea albida]SES12014.1 hypothetical protein SAMN04488000_11695 [Lentzea albida]
MAASSLATARGTVLLVTGTEVVGLPDPTPISFSTLTPVSVCTAVKMARTPPTVPMMTFQFLHSGSLSESGT